MDDSGFRQQAPPSGDYAPPPQPVLTTAGFHVPIGAGDEKEQDQVDHSLYSRLALKLDEDGWLPLVQAAYEDEKRTKNTFIKDCDIDNWIYYADEVLSTAEPAILKAICRGDVNATCKGDIGLGKIVQSYGDRSDTQATVYLHQMTVGMKKEALSIRQANDIALVALQYANALDTSYTEYQAGRRHFIEGSKGNVDSGKKRVLLGFSCALNRLADEAKKENKTHIPFLQYVGYAIKGTQRKKQHDSLASTSWLFLFTKYVCATWKNFLPTNMRNFTVCLITEEAIGPVAEMLLARLARAYYFAGGFSIGQAGASMSSLRLAKLSQVDREKVWEANAQYAKNMTNYTQIQAKELASRKNLQKTDYEKTMRQKDDEIAQHKQKIAAMRDHLAEYRAQIDVAVWEKEFPEELQEFRDFEKFPEEETNMLQD
ncbi:hypothetical protein AA0113_g11599 [Alternaria arborescens]|uniref:Uncharacterized protein n=1 Tax=Alternaria arborescens TaxID=156630 RepID=A0A4Q4Q6F6_9PLEO|nr:hypothetical protein AA0112_g1111 [Alternaria arborescens]RYO34632.1 hypothetical protein AA0113_g11599 [Alternaria arborescens]